MTDIDKMTDDAALTEFQKLVGCYLDYDFLAHCERCSVCRVLSPEHRFIKGAPDVRTLWGAMMGVTWIDVDVFPSISTLTKGSLHLQITHLPTSETPKTSAFVKSEYAACVAVARAVLKEVKP